MTAGDWTVIIGAIGIIITNVVGMVLSYLRDKAKAERDLKAAERVEAVRLAAKKTADNVAEVKKDLSSHREVVNDKLDVLEQKVVENTETTDSTHKIVNQQRTDMLDKIDALEEQAVDLKKEVSDLKEKGGA